jgi:hypothetical protein
MSETNVGASIPKQASPPTQASRAAGRAQETPPVTGWAGWIVFAGTMMMLLGALHVFQGFVALFNDTYFVAPKSGLTIHVDYTAWGWAHLLMGALVVAAGAGLLAGQMWARIVGVGLAFLSCIVNVAFLAAYPVWSMIMVAVDILVIWAITVHGSEMKTASGRRSAR